MSLIDWTRKIGMWFSKIPVVPHGKVYGPAPASHRYTQEEIDAYMREQHEFEVASGEQGAGTGEGTQDNTTASSSECEPSEEHLR